MENAVPGPPGPKAARSPGLSRSPATETGPRGCINTSGSAEANRRCPRSDVVQTEPSFKKSSSVAWDEALGWWNHGSLLGAPSAPNPTFKEAVYALPGLRTSASTNRSAVLVVYQNPDATVESVSYWLFINAGGISIEVRYYADPSMVPYQKSVWKDKTVLVRGKAADLKVMRRTDGDGNDWRTVRWVETGRQGEKLLWEIGNHPDLYSDEQTISFIDGLLERRAK